MVLEQELRAYIEERMAHYGVPGVAVGVLHGHTTTAFGIGVTNVNYPLPVDDRTLFQIGSTSKTFCGTATMCLVEQGKIDLDAPIRTYLPDLALQDEEVAAHVTMRHALGHASGWLGDYFDDLSDGDDALAQYVTKMAELPQLVPMKTIYSYNNAGFGLAGRVIEVVTGKPYETALQELVFAPLGLAHTYFFAKNVITEKFAVGHLVLDGIPTVVKPWQLPRTANAAGGIIADVRDQLAYAVFHMGDGTAANGARVLSSASIAEMQRPWFSKGYDGEMGVTWHIDDVGGVRVVRHGGATLGQLTAFEMVPEQRFAVTVLTNANRGVELHGDVTRWVKEHVLGISVPKPAHIAVSADALAEYVGTYTGALSHINVTLEGDVLRVQPVAQGGFPSKDDKIVAPPPLPVPVVFIGTDTIKAESEPIKGSVGEFLRSEGGAIAWLRMGGRILQRT